jgi:hypothetical protein
MGRFSVPALFALLVGFSAGADAQDDDYSRAVLALAPDHYYRLEDDDIGAPREDEQGNPLLLAEAGGYKYDGEVIDTGAAATKITGYFEGRFAPDFVDEPLAFAGIENFGPFVCGIDPANRSFFANNAGSVNLGPGAAFAHDVMTVSCWFLSSGSDGGDRIFTNNRPTRADHFQITLGGSANLVIGIDPNSETTLDALQVPDSVWPVKDGQWHHIVASRNGPTMANVRVMIDGVDYTTALVDSTTGWGRTGTDAHIASRPGGDGGPNRQTLNGAVDELAVWIGRQLTPSEAADLYWAGYGCSPPATVTRVPAVDPRGPGEIVEVALEVKADRPNTSVTISEALPVGVDVVEILDGGSLVERTIEWNLTGIQEKTVRYRLDPGYCSGDLSYGLSSFAVGESRRSILGPSVLRLATTDTDLGPWESVDIGATGGAVTPLSDHDLFIDATGRGITGRADEFRFVHQSASGDFELSMMVECRNGVGNDAQVGLMVRDTLDPHSAMVFFAVGPGNPLGGSVGVLKSVSRRETDPNRTTANITLRSVGVTAFPVYLRVRRAEGAIVLERSDDGLEYVESGRKVIGTASTEVNLRDDVLLGVAATAGGVIRAQYVVRNVSGRPFGGDDVPVFRRGDTNDDAKLDLTDAIGILGYLFLGSTTPTCLDSADADDDGTILLTDPILILSYLFLGGAAPDSPGPPPNACGADPAEGAALGCEAYASC